MSCCCRPVRVVVGRDIRLTSATLCEAFTQGLLESGVDARPPAVWRPTTSQRDPVGADTELAGQRVGCGHALLHGAPHAGGPESEPLNGDLGESFVDRDQRRVVSIGAGAGCHDQSGGRDRHSAAPSPSAPPGNQTAVS